MIKTMCVMGASASGKSTLINHLCEDWDDRLHYVKSRTTRKPRGYEDLKTHKFVTDECYEKDLASGKVLFTYHSPNGYYNYTTIDDFDKDKINVYAIDPDAFIELSHNKGFESIGVYVQTTKPTLKLRMKRRGKEFKEEPHLSVTKLFNDDSLKFVIVSGEENYTYRTLVTCKGFLVDNFGF